MWRFWDSFFAVLSSWRFFHLSSAILGNFVLWPLISSMHHVLLNSSPWQDNFCRCSQEKSQHMVKLTLCFILSRIIGLHHTIVCDHGYASQKIESSPESLREGKRFTICYTRRANEIGSNLGFQEPSQSQTTKLGHQEKFCPCHLRRNTEY